MAVKAGTAYIEILPRLDKLNAQLQAGMRQMSSKLGSVGKTLTRSVTLPIVGLGAAAVKSFVDVDKERKTGQVPIGPHGRTTLPPVVFPAKSRSRCRLLVHVPREYRERDYEVYVSQLYKGFEVGRVTWRIVARK